MATSKSKDNPSNPGISLDRAVSEISMMVEDSIDFQRSELESGWALAERYYNGFTDLETFEGRSTVTKTEVRDSIRNTLPSIMRVLVSSRKPVEFFPSSVQSAPWVEQQAEWARHLFFANDGYMQLYQAVHENLKLKLGVMKVSWEEDPTPEYVKMTKVPYSVIEALLDDPLCEVEEFEPNGTQLGTDDEIDLYDVEYVRLHENGANRISSIPSYEFFISRNCNSIEQALEMGIHGQRQIVTVDQAMQMGLEYDGDWLELDHEDPETSDNAESSQERRGYYKDDANDPSSVDVLKHQFLLTEAYVSYDLEDEGRMQIYRFYLGGTSHKYIDHVRVQDSDFAMISAIPIPHTAYGHAMADLMINEQDTSTSLLRAAVDNAHAANDARFIGDPTKVEFDDLMNSAINSPIRARQGATVQTVQVPFTAQGVMSVLQYLDLDNQNKIGITKAAQGLDPDALQSTDKEAVRNTIATSQGQTELMVRNIVESGLIRVFRLLLRNAAQHTAPIQMMQVKGKAIPVDQRNFDPDAVAYPGVGLGTGSPQQKQAALSWISQKQEETLQKYGPNNPFTSFAQLYNTLEDLLETNGIYNVGRYFNLITPKVEQEWAKAEQQKQAELAKQQAQNAPMDPSKAFLQVEEQKREIDRLKTMASTRDHERRLELDAIKAQEQLDLDRDKLVQDRVIKLAEIQQQIENEAIKQEQGANDVDIKLSQGSAGGSAPSSSRQKLPDSNKTPSGVSPNNGAGGSTGRTER